MLVLVAIDTEIFPVGAVLGIISVVAVFVMDGQKMSVFEFKLPPAFGADEAVYFKRLFTVIARLTGSLFQFPGDLFCGFFAAVYFPEITESFAPHFFLIAPAFFLR
jgi:hypothetical protein